MAIKIYRSDNLALLQHWHRHKSPRSTDFDQSNNAGISRKVGLIGPQVRHMNNLPVPDEPAKRDVRVVAQIELGIFSPRIGVTFLAVDCDGSDNGSVTQKKVSIGGFADAGR